MGPVSEASIHSIHSIHKPVSETGTFMRHLHFWARVSDARQAYGPIRGQLSILVPLHVFAIRVTWEPAVSTQE